MVVYNGIRCIEGILFIKPRIKFANNEEEYKKLLENQAYIDAMKARKFGINCNDALVDDAVSREITREDKFQIYCKRKQESERKVFGNIHSLQYYIHDIHVDIVFFS